MTNPRLATRYAKALIDLANERGQLEPVFADMQVMQQICKGNPDFEALLKSPVIKPGTKKKIVDAVTTGKIGELVAAFTRLLITKGRESNLPEIINAFISQYKKQKNIYSVHLTTAMPVSEGMKEQLLAHLRNTTSMQHIELETTVKENIIGGFVLQVDDQLVDASIAYDLKDIARQFENNDFIYKIR
ncbi:MAG: ATP synthase F1 subunit delta [Terrimonas sp.]|nr:ATP synthase F1 subunit delta [Terrimonas sp.]